ncbi:MAG: porin, partial [Chitinophagales bacterium]
MKHIFTRVFPLLFLILWLANPLVTMAQQAGSSATAPSDTSKKKQAPPPAQMLTFPVISDICKIKLNSYAQVRFQYYQPDKDTTGKDNSKPSSFDLRNARIILNGSPLHNFSYRLQVDFAPPTVRALDAYGSYTFFPYLKLTLGQQKVPLSYESLRTDYDIHSMSRSQAVEALTGRTKDVLATANSATAINNNGRDIGLQASGGIPNNNIAGTNWVDYALGVFDGQGINVSDPDRHKDIAGRAVVHPIKNLGVGGSFYSGMATYGVDKSKPKDRDRWGLEASYEDGKWIYAAAEYLQGKDSVTKKGGYYAEAEGFFIPKKASILVKYDFYDPSKSKSKDASTITSFALNY